MGRRKKIKWNTEIRVLRGKGKREEKKRKERNDRADGGRKPRNSKKKKME